MSISPFYDLDAIEKVAVNLFHGWGYNFYRLENQLRADDLLVRSKVGWLLGLARGSVDAAESAYRRFHLPAPTREKPRPDPEAIAGAQALERLSQAVGAAEGKIRALPAPENDRMTELYRREAPTLQHLIECDERLAGLAEMLRALLDGKSGEWMVEHAADVEEGLRAIETSLHARQAALFG